MSAVATPQHLEALALANTVRLARADLKRSIRAGHLTAAAVIADPPWFTQRMSVYELLCAQLRWGRRRTLKLLGAYAIGESRQIGALTLRQRAALVEALNTSRRNEK